MEVVNNIRLSSPLCFYETSIGARSHANNQAKHNIRDRAMSKPMSSEWSEMVISYRLLLPIFLLFWQLCAGATVDNSTKATSNYGILVESEERALGLLLNSLQSLRTSPQSSPLDLSCSEEDFDKITCSCDSSNRSCSIVKIKLREQQLGGYIPISVGDFKNLTLLILSDNQLSGGIPDSLGKLQSLKTLNLSGNMLTGPIPHSLTKLPGLQGLLLSRNGLTGSIPESLQMLHNLKVLQLDENDLEGTIPQNLTGLQSLKFLDLTGNKLRGHIPDSIRYCEGLEYMLLRQNFLTGKIPESLGTLSSLKLLDLYSNSLSGHIPAELGNLSALGFLRLDDNNLDGELPKELGNLTNLTSLYLSSNNFTGRIPDTYHKLVRMEAFVVGGNYLSGQIPSYIGNWVQLTKLTLLGNNFEGNLPEAIFGLPNLRRLFVSGVTNPGISLPKSEVISKNLFIVVLRNCKINGSIPEYIGNWPRLSYLDLSFNNLSGGIPESFQQLNKLYLTNNTLTKLPSWIGNEQQSSYLKADISYNDFAKNCTNLTCLGLPYVNIHPTRSFVARMLTEKCKRKHNSLYINCGGEEVKVGKHRYQSDTSRSSFYLSPNKDWAYSFAGDYLWATTNTSTLLKELTCAVSNPETKLYNNFRLAPVSLTYYGLCLRKGNYIVTLHFGEDTTIGKRVFDVYIQGRMVKENLDISGSDENKKLKFPVTIQDGSLEIKFFWTGKGTQYNPPSINGPLVSAISIAVPNKLSALEIAGITISCVLFPPLLLAFMWRMGWIGDRELRETKVKIGERTFSLKQIIDATRKFSSSKELGRGRSGIVYKAELPYLTVAVKKLFSQSKAVDEIASEVYAKKVLDLKHENLVQLLATHSKNHLYLLNYEFMEYGSLKQALFDPNPTVGLDWEKRFNICKGIAKGLNHLHQRNPQIIHRNIKATNILLNANCDAKISDFGLAKFYEEESSYQIMQAGGDASYMAPEYATRGAITVKVDVYSFGILLLEIVSGKNNADYSGNQESVFLLDTAGKLYARGKLADLVDARLNRYDWDQVNTILNLAIMCVDLSPSIRPTMSQILSVLEREKTLAEISAELNASA